MRHLHDKENEDLICRFELPLGVHGVLLRIVQHRYQAHRHRYHQTITGDIVEQIRIDPARRSKVLRHRMYQVTATTSSHLTCAWESRSPIITPFRLLILSSGTPGSLLISIRVRDTPLSNCLAAQNIPHAAHLLHFSGLTVKTSNAPCGHQVCTERCACDASGDPQTVQVTLSPQTESVERLELAGRDCAHQTVKRRSSSHLYSIDSSHTFIGCYRPLTSLQYSLPNYRDHCVTNLFS